MLNSDNFAPAGQPKNLTLISLNIAHARNNSSHQFLQTQTKIYHNLNLISDVLQREAPDIVALQEIDYNSFWNGRFDHVEYLAHRSGYEYFFSGNHTNRLRLSYGTAILSKYPLKNKDSVNLVNYRFLPAKGFVVSTVEWSGGELDVVSIHLDFASQLTRIKQVEQLINYLEPRKRPCLLMGDFNTSFKARSCALDNLARSFKLTTFEPLSNLGGTFRFSKKRWDWILVPEEATITEYFHLPDVLSDHKAIKARITFCKPDAD